MTTKWKIYSIGVKDSDKIMIYKKAIKQQHPADSRMLNKYWNILFARNLFIRSIYDILFILKLFGIEAIRK